MTQPAFKDAALQLHGFGANVNAIGERTKSPIHKWKHWYDTRQSEDEVRRLPWRDAAGLGGINGINGWRTFDLDPKKEDEHGNKLAPDQVQPVPESVLIAAL